MVLAGLTIRADDLVVLAFGDSTTAVRGKLKVYTSLLQRDLSTNNLPVRVINAGVGGHNTRHARARFKKDVLSESPDIVVIQFGINDAAVDVWKKPPATESRVSLTDYEMNLRHFITTLRARNIGIILMTPNPLRWTPKMRSMYGKLPYDPNSESGFNVRLLRYAKAMRQVAASAKVPLVDIYQTFERFGNASGQSVDDLLLDGIHPNDRGQHLVADRLLPVILTLAKARSGN